LIICVLINWNIRLWSDPKSNQCSDIFWQFEWCPIEQKYDNILENVISRFNRNRSSPVVDGWCGYQSIADQFASIFSSTCVPNSEARHSKLCEEFHSCFVVYDCVDVCTNRITCELLETCSAQLKQGKGKAPGFDGLTVEHITHAHPILFLLCHCYLTRCICIYGTVPDALGVSIAISFLPLVKNWMVIKLNLITIGALP